jgi:hypothetical protein
MPQRKVEYREHYPLSRNPSTPEDIDNANAKIREYEERFPFPENLRRTEPRKWLTRFMPKKCVGAEVGVFRGHFSEVLCQQLRPKRFYLIDQWTLRGEFFGFSTAYTNYNTLPTSVARHEATLRVARHYPVDYRIIEARIPENQLDITETLDWVYLDASHRIQDTYDSLCFLDRILSADGVIAGDDYWSNPNGQHYGVMLAVHEFIRDYRYQLIAAGPAGQFCIRKFQQPRHPKPKNDLDMFSRRLSGRE